MTSASGGLRARCLCSEGVATDVELWNHKIRYYPIILGVVPSHARRALDVGCSDGVLVRRLQGVILHITSINLDSPSIDLARHRDDSVGRADYVLGDFLTYPFEPGSFDRRVGSDAPPIWTPLWLSSACAKLLGLGGTLVIVGLARPDLPADLPLILAGVVATRWYRLTRTRWERPSPTVWPPPETFAGMRSLAARVLPGVRDRRHLLWRQSLTWTKPQR